MKEVPRRLLVLGGGPVGVEMAQAVRRFGGEVAVVEGSEHLLAREPAPLGEALAEALRRDGVELALGVQATSARQRGRRLRPRARRRQHAPRRPAARRHRAPAPRRRDRPGDGRHRGRRPRGPGRLAAARGRATLGDRRRHRHLAADPRRRVPGRRRRLEHPRRAARRELRRRAPRRLHRSAGGSDRRHGAAVQRDRTRWQGRAQDRDVHTRLRRVERVPDAAQRRRAPDRRVRARPGGGRVAAAGDARDPRAGAARGRCATRSSPSRPSRRSTSSRSRRSAERSRRPRRSGARSVVSEGALRGQTVVVIGGSAGIGLETARLARAEGAEVVLAARNPERLERGGDGGGRAQHGGLRRHRLRPARPVLRRAADADRPRAGHRSRSLLRAAGRVRRRRGAPRDRGASDAADARSPTDAARQGSPGRDRCSSWAAPAAAARRRGSAFISRSDGCASGPDEEPRARARARSV